MMPTVLFLVLIAVANSMVAKEVVPKGESGTCQCSAFPSEIGAGEPIVSKTPGFKVPCDEDGKKDCQKMCIALGEAAKERLPKAICEAVKVHIEGLTPAGFFKACDAPEWSYTGLKASEPICCHDGMVRRCGSSGA